MGTFTQDNKSSATKQTDAAKTTDTSKTTEDQAADKKAAEDKAADDAGAGTKLKDETDTKKLESEKDRPIGEENVKQPTTEVPVENPNEPAAIVDETAEERADRHDASDELAVQEVTDYDFQADTDEALEAGTKIVPGAASGPDSAGVVVNDSGKVAYAPPGTLNAAMNGVQEDASGHVSSVHTDNSSLSGVRI